MGRQWSNSAAAIRYYQLEGFIVGKATCYQCENTWIGIVEPDAKFDTEGRPALECPVCKNFKLKSFAIFSL